LKDISPQFVSKFLNILQIFYLPALVESFGKKEKGNFFEMRKFIGLFANKLLNPKIPKHEIPDTENFV